jgi:hypothetical protein
MGAFGAGLVQGAQDAVAMKSQREQIEMQKKYYDTLGKKMDLELQMAQRQIQGQQDLVKSLFRPPRTMPVTAQGPGAPVPLQMGEADQFLQTLSPQEMAHGRGIKEIQERGPGFFKEGPQPTGTAEVPGTAGLLASASPELQAVFQNMLDATGGDMGKTLSTLAMLAPGAFPQQPMFQKLGEGETLAKIDPRTGQSTTLAQGAPKTRGPIAMSPGQTLVDPVTGFPMMSLDAKPEKPDKPMVVPAGASLMTPEGTLLSTAPEKDGKPNIREVDTPQGRQFVHVTPEGVQPIGQPIQTAPKEPKGIDQENAVAKELYGKNYADLDQAQATQVNRMIQQRRIEVAGATAGIQAKARIEEQQTAPLSVEEANKLGVPYGTTREQANGMMVMTPQQREAITGFDTARTIIADIQKYSERVNTASAGLSGRGSQAMKLWGAWTQSDPDAALLMSKAGELASVARSLGEKGALANQDVARAAALIPSVLDTREVAAQKIQDMMTIINQGELNFRKSLGVGAMAPVQTTPAPAPAAAPKEQAKPAEPAEDPRVSKLGPGGMLGYKAAKDKTEFLDRYFNALEKTQHAKQ